ncbi:MAG TPA: flagellar hook assembly protein FlgD [Spirochaetia bacterium]|jgi:flagellar basal-body rod modification protein FlgD|nr:flagellar hook assembly protein FlgD [Spirochaetia bacterium]
MDAMNISTQMSAVDQAKVAQSVDAFNKTINHGKTAKTNMDKDDFLKILITQLTTQDPSQPLQDKDFIAQMAQFSSLEQMTNMASSFGKVSNVITASQAVSTIGKDVEIQLGDQTIKGTVSAVTPGQFPQVLVGDKYYDFGSVQKISASEVK